MTEVIENIKSIPAEGANPQRLTKAATVIKLLSRTRGATLADIMATTNWQPHSTRAFLTGLRKKGYTLLKEARRNGETSYRLDR